MNYELVDTILYTGEDGSASIKVIVDDENNTMWTTQQSMAELFKKDVKTISKHLNNIFRSEELVKEEVSLNPNNSTNSRILIINPNSKKQPILYNLDAIISVGYRVNSKQATHFRRWATKVLKEYIIKGFVLDEELLKNNGRFGVSYFPDLLKKSVKSDHLKDYSTKNSQISTQPVSITIPSHRLQGISLLLYKIHLFSPFQIRLLLK